MSDDVESSSSHEFLAADDVVKEAMLALLTARARRNGPALFPSVKHHLQAVFHLLDSAPNAKYM